jgi:Sec-independent protein secretion pathway component TatC
LIKLLAKFFRGVHLIFGVSAPPEDQNERTFVLIWLGIAAFLVAFGVALTYFFPYLYFKR